jgi:hypothetical protein
MISRISIRNPAIGVLNGGGNLSPDKKAMLLELWEFLECLRLGVMSISLPPTGTRILSLRLPSGNAMVIVVGRPAPTDPDYQFDIFLSHILWR